jgi:hypothetical protein
MRCIVTLKDGAAMERAMAALAKHRYTAGGERVVPEAHPREWSSWLLEINSAEFEAIHDHVYDGDVVDMKPINELVRPRRLQGIWPIQAPNGPTGPV